MCTCKYHLAIIKKAVQFLLKGKGVVVLAGLTVSHKVAGLLTQPEQRLCICSADRSVVPAISNDKKKEDEWTTKYDEYV